MTGFLVRKQCLSSLKLRLSLRSVAKKGVWGKEAQDFFITLSVVLSLPFTASHCGSAAARKTKSKAEEEALRRGSREGISEAPDQASRGGKEKARGQRKTGKEKTGKEKPTDPNALRWFVILLEIHLLIIFMGLSREKIGRSKRSGRKAPGDQTTGACPRPRRAGAHKKSVPRGAPMQLIAPRRNPECSNGHFNTLE